MELGSRSRRRLLRKLAEKAVADFNLHKPRLRYLAEHTSVLFSVTDSHGRQYVLKIANPEDYSEKELLGGLSWLECLHELSAFPATKPLRTVSGSLCTTVTQCPDNGLTRKCMLFTWVPGVGLYHRLSKPNAYKWGRLLALMHQQSQKIKTSALTRQLPRYDKVFHWDEQVLLLEKDNELLPAKRTEVFRKAISRVSFAIKDLFKSGNSPIVLHGDLHPDNLKVFKGELYALDFADCMWGFPIQDLSIALTYIRERQNYRRLRTAFEEGYKSIQNWPEEKPGQIETFFMGRLIVIANALVKSKEHCENACETIHSRLARYETEFKKYLDRFP